MNEQFTFDKRDWLLRSYILNDRADRMHEMPDGMFHIIAEDGSVIAAWDDIGQFGCIMERTLWCPVGDELDDQLIAAWLPLLDAEAQAAI
jgi:hypothetical protein